MSEVFSILLHNRQRYDQGKEGLWFSLPTTTEKLQEALREIGISADNPQDFFLYDYRSPQERPIKLPRDLVLSADVDELNFLAARLEKLDAAELTELNAALTSPQSDFHSIGQIIDYPDNVDYYVHLPDVTGTGQLGDYYLNRSGMVDMPEEWKAGIFLPRFGLHIANTEHGVFTDYGYLVKSGDEWQRVHEGQPVPEEYRVMAYPAPEADRDAFRTEQPAPAAVLPEAAPIITKDKSKDEYMKEITDRLEAGVRGIMSSDNYKSYLASMSKFHSYSFRNTMLIFMQKPDASLVAGLGKWKSEFERTRKQGEIGLKILAPAYYKVKKRVPKIDPDTGEPIKDKDGKTVMEEQTITVPDYRAVSVYDVSQTEGKELPTTHVDVLDGDVEHFQNLQAALTQASPYPISIEPILDGAKGRCFYLEQRIAVNEGMSELQTLKTSIHEVAHARLYEKNSNLPEDQMPDRATREVQAESVAYTVCQYFGLDTSDYSFGYIANWSSGKDLEELQASLETIRSTANDLINEMEAHLLELQQQRQAQQTVEQTVEPTVEQAAEQPAPDSVFSKLPPEQQQEMTDSVKAMLQTLIDADVKSTGEVTQGTLDAIQTQGFVLSGDGTLQRAEAQPEPQPWNGIDGLLNNKPIMPEATPTERANALIDWAEHDGQRMGNEERRLIVEYAEAVGDTDKVIELINRLCEQGYEMQHGHMDDFVRSQIESEIAVAKAEQQTALDPAAEPVVTIIWSESPHLKEGQTMPLHEADALFAKLDAEYPAGMGYDKTKFRIDFTFRGQPDNYEGRQDFGDGDGSLIQHIQSYHEYYAQDESWKNHVIAETGLEGWEQDKAERDMLLGEFVPYMKLHCNLSHMEQEARRPLLSGEELTPEQSAYFHAVLDYVQECRPLLNQGQYQLPEPPKLSDFDQTLQDYKEQVQAEIAQEAAAAGMTVEEYAAAGYEAPHQDTHSTAEPQAQAATTTESLTDLQKKAVEIAEGYKKLPLQDKIGVIAQAFGCTTGKIETSPCSGKWRGTSDISIQFDNGTSLFIGNHVTPKAKTAKVQNEYVDSALVRFNPEIISATKKAAIAALIKREAIDNAVAAQKGLKPYTVLNVEFDDGTEDKHNGYMGWYYVTLAVDGKICTHMETGLNYDIAGGKVSEIPTKENYYTAGALKEADVDYVFNNVGFSSTSELYSLPISGEVLERAEKALAERTQAQPAAEAPTPEQAEPPQQDTFTIYQIPSGPEMRDYRYRGYEELQAAGLAVEQANYDLVYTAPLDEKATLEDIYRTFNIDHPADFKGHSLSVSDVVVLQRGGQQTAHYCDSFGFQEVPEFMRENPLRTAELSTEQNENMIDGVINNAPSEPQPEEPEQLSFEDLAAASGQTQEETPEAEPVQTAVRYYPINEGAARRAKEAISYSGYRPGSATAEYRHYVDQAVEIAERQKKRVEPEYHEKIDQLLDTYARKLAENMNHGYEITARVPSVLIAGPANFPVRAKEKQNAASDRNMEEFQYIQGLLDKIRSTGMGGISADDPQAVSKLEKKLEKLEASQELMKAVNAYYRKHGTLDGCPHLTERGIENLKADMASGWHYEKKPFQSWQLSNNNAEIRRLKGRIEELTRHKEAAYVGWEFDGGTVEINREANRLQIFFEGKPDAAVRDELKSNGFRWSPKAEAWQRQLNDTTIRVADRIKCIQPLSGEKPSALQLAARREKEKPSIRAQLQASKAEPAKKPPAREKSKGLEVE